MSNENLDLIIALSRVQQFAQFSDFPTSGSSNKIYVDRANNIIYRWDGSSYIQVTSSGTQPINFLGTYNAQTNTPTISSGSGTVGDFYLVSVANGAISPPIDGITELNLDDQLLAQPAQGGGTEWVRVPALNAVVPPIKINSSQTLTQLNGTYLVDAQTDLTLTIPTAAVANQSRFIRIVKETGTGTITVVPTSGDSFIGDDQDIIMRSIGDVVTVFSSGTTTDGWAIIQRSLQDLLVDQIEFLKNGNTEPLESENWRVVVLANGLLSFQRREANTWVEKQALGGSVFSDIFYASGVAGGVRYNDSDNNREVELIRLSPGGTIISFGDENLNATIVSDDDPRAIVPTTGSTVLVDVNTVDTDAQAGTLFNFQFTSVNGGRIESVVVDTDGLDRVRIAITENVTGITVYETVTLFDFENNNGGVAIPSGRQTIPLERVARIQQNLLYDVTINVATSGTINGNATPSFVPYLQYNLLEVEFCELAYLPRIRTLAADTTIGTTEYRRYKNNTVLFTQDLAADVTLTITDGVFENDDTLTVLFYPTAQTNEGQVIIQAGATGTINGSNSVTILRDSSIEIKHMGGDDWIILTDSEAPITIRRDTPTVEQMTALTRVSLNGNSAFWLVANDQLLANEQNISDSITIQALRDDLLDLNGNPIPTTATQKNTSPILLEAGTMCRVFSPTNIRVVFTPERSTSTFRTELENADLTITSSNIRDYRNDVILFTQTTGELDLTINDDVFNVNDEIIVKHYADGAQGNVRVNITQQGTGANIDGNATVTLMRGQSVKLKYIGNNAWRILNMLGSMSASGTTSNPDVHNFSIGIPSRVDVGASPDPVNVTAQATFSVTHHELITSIELHIGTDTFAMTAPGRDGVQTQDVIISGIDISTAQNYNMFIRINGNSAFDSNIQVLRIANPVVHELLYYDIQASGQANAFNYQSATAQSQDITGSENIFTVPTFTGNNYLAIAQPASETEFTDIFINGFAQLGAFTKTDDAVQINSINYDVWVSNNALNGSVVSGNTIRVVR